MKLRFVAKGEGLADFQTKISLFGKKLAFCIFLIGY
jgi:hypothetical protein